MFDSGSSHIRYSRADQVRLNFNDSDYGLDKLIDQLRPSRHRMTPPHAKVVILRMIILLVLLNWHCEYLAVLSP